MPFMYYYPMTTDDLFTRYTEILLRNFTFYDWKLKHYNVIGGHFDRYYPPKEIRSNSIGVITTSNSGLGYIQGPEGTITYTAVIDGIKTDIIFYYLHPVGPSKSIYTISTNPSGMVKYDLDPANPEGWNQSVMVNVYNKD
ncbi:hypothetical protein PV797_02645 [Clostridiaceae bacterium M8S5]|nr:hypothetical protein PV797_02645 [Clostridiaceae bacterium M8S5]